VSFSQSRAYCQAQGKRLPSEEEWELAARGSEGRAYPWGDAPPSGKLVNACGSECSGELTTMLSALGKEGWPAMHADDDGATATAAVGSFPAGASAAGVLDLAGNVWEWTASPYCPYGESDCGDSRRVLRGGGWDVPDPGALRSSRRFPGVPSGRGHNIGFRCAWSPGS
jgi:formylglycine-generating enzyme required for sulfatase activity